MWAAVVPVKDLAVAKSRLGADPAMRAALALAMATDVVRAALDCPAVDGVVVVTNDARAARVLEAAGARVVADSADAGLNPALAGGARVAAAWWPRAGVVALSSDLPCLRPDELAAVLDEASAYPRAVVPDASGDGTTVLTARAGVPLDPRFGPGSRHAHAAAGAQVLGTPDQPGVRRDVDTPADLRAAVALGVGPHTAAALRVAPGPVGG